MQAGIENWSQRWSRLTGAPAATIPRTGLWDDTTRICIAAIQNIIGVNELGTVGPATWEALYPTRP